MHNIRPTYGTCTIIIKEVVTQRTNGGLIMDNMSGIAWHDKDTLTAFYIFATQKAYQTLRSMIHRGVADPTWLLLIFIGEKRQAHFMYFL